MAHRKQKSPRLRVQEPKRLHGLIYVVDASNEVIALIPGGHRQDAHLMAAAPDLFERLLEVRALRHASDGKPGRPLLPPDVIKAIDETLALARGEK
jgi:hypothetical protein